MADLDKLANSTASVVSTRLIVIALPFLMAIIGWLASSKLDDIKAAQSEFWKIAGAHTASLNEIKTSQAVSNANFAAHLQSDNDFDNTVKAAIQDHENRLRMIAQPPIRP